MRRLLANAGSALIILLFATNAHAQEAPCGPDSLLETDCYDAATNNTSCTPCYTQYCVTWDLTWGQACDAFCYQESPDVCSPARTVIQSGFDSCVPNLQACGDPSYPYLCHYYTYTYDSCTDNICSPKAYGGYFCNNRAAQLEDPRPKTQQVACGAQPRQQRLDRWGPRVDPPRPSAIPAGLLLKARYEVIKKSWRPGDKCMRARKSHTKV